MNQTKDLPALSLEELEAVSGGHQYQRASRVRSTKHRRGQGPGHSSN